MSREKDVKICKTSIGGQAVIEGVMMRGPYKMSLAVRNSETGEIAVETEELKQSKRKKIFRLPFIRGVFNFVDSMTMGVKKLMRSAKLCGIEDMEEEPSRFEKWLAEKTNKNVLDIAMFIAPVIGLLLCIVLFIMVPTYGAGFINYLSGGRLDGALSLIEGIIKFAIFLLYLILISQMKDIKRVFMYHGAEHKSIHCYEHFEELTVENVRKYKRTHPRCGTSFLFIVMILSVLIFAIPIFPVSNRLLRMLIKILLLPVIAGISYELIKIAGKYDNWFTKILSAPGKAIQLITTKEPDDSQIEVAIAALKEVIPEKAEEAQW